MTLDDAIGVLISASEARSGQWRGVASGMRPDSLIDELWEADAVEADYLANLIDDAIGTVRQARQKPNLVILK